MSSITLRSTCPPWLSTPEVCPRADPSQSRGLTRFQTAMSLLKLSKMSCQKPSRSRRHTTKHSKHRSSTNPSNSSHGDLTKLATRCSTAKGFKTISSPMKRNYVSRATMQPKTNPSWKRTSSPNTITSWSLTQNNWLPSISWESQASIVTLISSNNARKVWAVVLRCPAKRLSEIIARLHHRSTWQRQRVVLKGKRTGLESWSSKAEEKSS